MMCLHLHALLQENMDEIQNYNTKMVVAVMVAAAVVVVVKVVMVVVPYFGTRLAFTRRAIFFGEGVGCKLITSTQLFNWYLFY